MRPHQFTLTVFLLIICVSGFTGSSARAEAPANATPPAPAEKAASAVCPICGRANDRSADYATKAGHTLARGATNTLLGWTEVIQRPAEEVKRGGNVFNGIAQGAGQGLWRTIAGAGELLTFWTPKVNQGDYMRMADNCPLCMGQQPTKPRPKP